ncbi:MAG: family 16 glycosylhydrolase [Fibrobacter sp.]|jgi:beta-glucanase (GH16 family)|nr:family 16 glycosylhydrolase [Fibrobacter sp.]
MNIKKTAVKGALAVAATVAALTTNVSAKDFSGAELYTLQEVQYGKFEARMKMAAASGTVSSMFLYQNGSEIADGRPWVEVDIEVLGKNPGSFQSNIITGKAGAQKTSEQHHQVSPATDQAFHTYGLEWTPNYVRWTVDGKEVRKTEGGQVSALTGTQGLRFNLWSSEDPGWVGQFDQSKLPLFQFINWVKVYKYTPGKGEGGSDFTLDWTDNFDSFDGSRWGKGDWTFDGNRVDLTDKNIYSKDGMLILALTRKGQESFNGQVPKDDEPAPVSSSSVASSSSKAVSSSSVAASSSSVASSSSQVTPTSSSSETDAIRAFRTTPTVAKERRGLVNAKGAKVSPNGHKRYRVNFEY